MYKKTLFAISIIFTAYTAQADDKSFLATVFTTISDKHLTEVASEDLSVSGLKVLSSIDKNLTFANGKDMVYLYYKGKSAAMWRKPKNNKDTKAWASLVVEIIEKAAKISPTVNQQKEDIAEKVIHDSVDALQDHSQYHFAEEPDKDISQDRFSAQSYDNILYVRIKEFGTNTPKLFRNAIISRPHTSGIILDLRGNHGGQLSSAIEIAQMFIDDGIIVSTIGRGDEAVKYYVAHTQPQIINLPLAVLIDKNTASSAEMLAAALQEQIQATIIGTISYGKGTIQDTFVFDNGGRLALTTAEFFAPSGSKIEKIGILPDYCILNDQQLTNNSCSQQKREGRPFDVDFAQKILKKKIDG